MEIYCADTFFFFFWLQSDIGFGKMETYDKMDKLGEVRKYSEALPRLSFCVRPIPKFQDRVKNVKIYIC